MVRSIGYDTKTQTLEVQFLSGWVYQYYGVPAHMHDPMMETPSKGRFLNMYCTSGTAIRIHGLVIAMRIFC